MHHGVLHKALRLCCQVYIRAFLTDIQSWQQRNALMLHIVHLSENYFAVSNFVTLSLVIILTLKYFLLCRRISFQQREGVKYLSGQMRINISFLRV